MKCLVFLLLLAACSGPHPAPGTSPAPAGTVIAERLSNQRVNAFAEDGDGHIWIGTFRGLDKYTVHDYHQYFATGDTLGLPDNQITALLCSASGQLWAATMNGVAVRDADGRFHSIPGSGSFSGIAETRDGQILFSDGATLQRYDPESGRIRPVVRDYGGVFTLIGQDGRIWSVNGLTELRCYDPRDFRLTGSWPTRHQVYHGTVASTGELWLSGMGELSIFDPRSERWLEVPAVIRNERRLSGGDIDILFTNGPEILLHTISDGMFCYNQGTGRLLHQSDPDFPYEVPEFEIRTMFRDSRGNLWFGSTDQGYSVSYAARNGFDSNRFLTDFFRNKSVVSLCPDRAGNLWISTLNDGLYVHELGKNTVRSVNLRRLVPDSNIGYICCYSIFCDAQGELWLVLTGKYRTLRCRFDGRELQRVDQIDMANPATVSQDDLGRIWIANYNGQLLRYDKDTRKTDWTALRDDPRIAPTVLLQLEPGRMLAATFDTTVCEVYTNSVELRFRTRSDAWESSFRRMPANPTCMYKDGAGDIWYGTVGSGLLRYDLEERRTLRMEGLSCQDICSVQEDLQGNVWVSTMNGLCRYDRTVGSFTQFFESDGIGGNQFCDRSSCLLPDGTLVFGGTHGITWFNPLDIRRKQSVPLVFEDLRVHNNLVLPGKNAPIAQELSTRPDVTIRHDQNGFSISYAALDYSEHAVPRYEYMMDGFDHYWVDAGTANESYYANLPAGRYTFRVRLEDEPDTEQSLSVRVLPPWYRSWWAAVLYALAAILLLLFLWLVYRRIHRVRKEAARHIREVRREREMAEAAQEQEKHLNRIQMDYFANVAHEFRTPLTMIAGPVEQLAASEKISGEDRKLLGIVQRSSTWMLSLVGQLLDFNRIANKKLQLKVAKGDIVEPLRGVADLFHFNAEMKGIELATYGLEDSFVMWRDADKVTKITMNLLSNALKFTPTGGKVSLSFDVLPREEAARDFPLTEADTDLQYAQISVSDTGCGIPEDQLEDIFDRFYQAGNRPGGVSGSGIGLFYSRALASLHHGYIHARNRDEGGAVFTLILPVSATSYSEDERTAVDPFQQPLPQMPAAPAQESEESGVKRRIVVVDDDIDVANYVKMLLSADYSVIVHFDADSALKAMEEEAPDLVISDVVMPGRSGYELCEAVKGDLQLSHIPVILVTAAVAVENQVQGLNKGADAYVTKPFNPAYLKALVKSQLENRDKLRQRLGSVTSTEEIGPEAALSPRDSAFMKKLYELMDKELANQELDITRITEMMRISRTKFYYKVKGLTGENPGVFFKRYKLNRAADLLKEGKFNMSEIAYMTGFNTLSHFSTSFKKQFGVPPSEYTG